jgi:hypothetical protein
LEQKVYGRFKQAMTTFHYALFVCIQTYDGRQLISLSWVEKEFSTGHKPRLRSWPQYNKFGTLKSLNVTNLMTAIFYLLSPLV